MSNSVLVANQILTTSQVKSGIILQKYTICPCRKIVKLASIHVKFCKTLLPYLNTAVLYSCNKPNVISFETVGFMIFCCQFVGELGKIVESTVL